MTEKLIFSESQQQATLAHALYRGELFDVLDQFGVNKEWFATETLAAFYGHIQNFRKAYKRPPSTWQELTDSIKDVDVIKNQAVKVAEKCEAALLQYQWDVLEVQLTEWSKGATVFAQVKQIAEDYNNGKLERAVENFHKTSQQIERIDSLVNGEQNRFESAAVRVIGEEDRRNKELERILPFNIKYLNDCLKGIMPSDVILYSAGTGMGKTEAAKGQAAFIAKTKQVPVHYFALEAAPDEIERRIKFGMMGQWFREDNDNGQIPKGMITFANFMHCRLDNEFAPYKQRADDQFKKDYKHLYTYYSNEKLFTQADLEKKIFEIKNEAALIVLDHLHYMDLGENENREMSGLVKGIRAINQTFQIPFILVCHIKKSDKKAGGLVPDLDDIYGSGSISKVCTQAVMFSKAYGYMSPDKRSIGVPTFIRTPKVRIDGSATLYTGVCFFDYYTSGYTPYYGLGRLNRRCDKWEPAFQDWPFWVDHDSLIKDSSPVD
jgi:replicative DNA helicase